MMNSAKKFVLTSFLKGKFKVVFVLAFLFLNSLIANSQNIVSVSFKNGAIGTKGGTPQTLNNLTNFQTLLISKAYFIQNSSAIIFQVQGNDISGTLRLVTNSNNFVDIPGNMVWSSNGNPNTYMGFLPASNLTSFNLNTYGGANYVINNTKNFALVLNNQSATFTNDTNIGGNASSPLRDLNDYLSTFNTARPTGPVTVVAQTTSSTTPTITGTATLGSGETLSIEFNGVVYTSGISFSGTTWSWTVPSSVALGAGTYNVVATITDSGGYTLSDTTNGELVISSVNFANLGCITIVANGGDNENSTWTYANNTITPNSATAVSLNVADVLAKMSLGDLKIESNCITVSTAVTHSGNGSSLTLGRVGSTNTVVINGAISTAGPILSYANLITTNSNLTTSAASAVSLLGSAGLRFGNAGITLQTQGGDIILSSDYDANSVGNIISEGALTLTSNGGAIRLGGGPTATDFAYGTGSSNLAYDNQNPGIWVKGAVNINSGNGDIFIKGYAANASPTIQHSTTWGVGLGLGSSVSSAGNAVSINSGSGKILVEGWARNPTGSNSNSFGVVFNNWESVTAQALTITSANTTSDAIRLIGNTENTAQGQRTKFGLSFWSSANSITATATGGGITLSGKTFDGNDHQQINWSGGNILATSGPINLSTEKGPMYLGNDMYVGSRSAVNGSTTSSSNIRFSIDNYSVAANKLARIASTGTLTIEAYGDSFTNYNLNPNVVLPFSTATGWSFNENSQPMSGLNIGKAANLSNITIGTSTSVAGPVNIYGGDITINGDINTSTGNANGDILLKASGAIVQNSNKSVTTNGGDAIYWADSDGNGAGDIFFGALTDYTDPASIQTGGGNLWLGGGSGTATWNGLTVGDGYAIGDVIRTIGGSFTHTNGITIQSTIINTAGGHIKMMAKGKSGDSPSIYSSGMYLLGTGSMNSGGGNIEITALAQTGTGNKYGLYNLGPYTFAPGAGALTITGDASASAADTGGSITGRGVFLWQNVLPIVSTGNITLNGVKSSASGTVGIDVRTPITTTGGDIIINGDITINSTLTTGATVRIETAGAVTQTGAITANALSLNGTGTFTLNNTSNNISVLYGGDSSVKLGSVSFTDASGGLFIAGRQGPAITASGTVLIETLVGDITLIDNIVTDNTTANAILINAGKSAAIGTATGGNIIVSGSPTITTGTGGITKLFSGSDASSTGLTTLVGGASNTRNGVDETSSTFTPVLVANRAYALYRQAVVVVAPVITSFSPSTAGNGQTVVITGTGFSGVSIVKFGNVNATSFVVDSDTQITAVVGAAVSGDVLVQNSAGNDTATGFTFKIVEYGFEGNALDETDANLDATVTGTATYGPGASGQAICFTNTVSSSGVASTNYLTLPSALLSSRTAFTVSLRFKTTSEGGLLGYQNRAGNVTPTNWVPIIYINQEGKLSGNLWIGSILNVTSPSRVDDGNWHKVEFAVTSTSITIYLDGVSLGSANGVIQHLDMTFNQLGASYRSNWPSGNTSRSWVGFNGCIDEFVIVDRGLSLSEITQLTQLPQPTISSFSPTSAITGQTITITGTNFTGATTVQFGNVNATSFVVVSPTQITAVLGNSVDGIVEVFTAAGTASATGFTVANSATTPAVPTITTIAATETSLTVNYTAPTSDGGSAITNYEYSTDGGSTWVTPSPATTTSPLTITGLSLGVTYNVKVRAVNSIGSGTASNSVSATTQDPTCSAFASTDFQTNGGTTYSNNVYTLTPDLGGQNGSVWNQNRVYLDQDFDFKTKVFLGSNDAGGADGIAFVLQNQSLSAGSSVGGLGYAGISPSFAVEFDTYDNGAVDPTQDHIALIANGNTVANHNTYTPVYEVEMENGQWHTARFVWDASAKNFQVWYDGVRIHNATIDLKADIFNGKPYVYWGMTGATGGAKNLQQVEFESYCYVQQVSTSALAGTNNAAASLSFCTGGTVRLQASASASYQWFKDGVAISGATARELEASESGAYTVESVSSSTQISTTSEVATVTVNPLPAFTYSSTYSFERTKAITTVSPASTGGVVTSYAISAALPAGLSFNTTTGRISGTPTALSSAVTYTVTGTSASSCVSTTTFSLEVFNAVIPSALSYSPSTQTVRVGTAITAMTPSSSGGAVGTYTISPALPAGLTINPTTGIISGTLTQAQTGSITYTVTATNTGGSDTAEITLVFNTAPTDLALSPASVDENKASGSSTGTLSSTDIDSGDTHTYALVSGTGSTDNALFTIDGANLKTTAAFDFETKSSYSVRLSTTDAGGLSFEKAITITVLNVNEAPTNIAPSNASTNENVTTNTILIALSATDVDAGDTHSYTLVSGTGSTDNRFFAILDGNKLVTTPGYFLDYETQNSYTVRVRATDAGGLTFEKIVTITVLDLNESPTNLALSATTINENNAVGAIIGELSSTDQDAGDTHTYTLVSGTGSTDNALFSIDGNYLKAKVAFDFETKSSYTVRVRTTDAGGLTFEKAITITVININDAPTDLALSSVSIYENNAVGAIIGNLSSTDQDAGDKHSYTLVSGDVAAFKVSGTQLLANAAYVYGTKNSYDVVVKSTDAGGLSVNKAIRITILQSPVLTGSANLARNNQSSAVGQNVTISKGYSANLNLSASGIVKYAWSPATGLSSTNISNPIAKPTQTTTYTVRVTNAQGISTDVFITVTVLEDYNITPNNVLSPDGDGVNDFWTIENLSTYPNNEVKIFDKAGRVIFNVKNYQNNWDGQLNGATLHEGAYYYIINLGSGTRPKIGYITIFSNK